MSEKISVMVDDSHPFQNTLEFQRLVAALIDASSLINSDEIFVGFDLPHLGKLLTVSVEKLDQKFYTHCELRDAAELDAESANVVTSGVQ